MNQDDFGYYHPELEDKEKNPFNFREGKSSDWTYGSGIMGHSNTAAIWGWNGDDFGDWEIPLPIEEKKCECGSAAIRWPVHSDWCPKYRRPTDGKES